MTTGHPLGTIARIWSYPVKSLAPREHARAHVDARGLEGDRHAALFVADAGHARTGKPYRGKEHERLHTVASAAEGVALGAARDVRLDVHDAGPYFDLAPLSIVFDTWIAELERLADAGIDPQRFRPNVFVRTEPGLADAERDLVGAVLEMGSVALRCTQPITRCVTPTYDLATGERSPAIARAIARDRGNVLGIYCEVVRGGEIATGEALFRIR